MISQSIITWRSRTYEDRPVGFSRPQQLRTSNKYDPSAEPCSLKQHVSIFNTAYAFFIFRCRGEKLLYRQNSDFRGKLISFQRECHKVSAEKTATDSVTLTPAYRATRKRALWLRKLRASVPRGSSPVSESVRHVKGARQICF